MKKNSDIVRSESWYLDVLLDRTTKENVDEWLRQNPPPREWPMGPYSYAYLEMPLY